DDLPRRGRSPARLLRCLENRSRPHPHLSRRQRKGTLARSLHANDRRETELPPGNLTGRRSFSRLVFSVRCSVFRCERKKSLGAVQGKKRRRIEREEADETSEEA